VGFAGSITHNRDDLDIALPALLECGRLPHVELHFWGAHPRFRDGHARAGLLSYAGVPYHYHGEVPDFFTYHRQIGLLDVAVAPLADTIWNRCKSGCKWLENALHGTPMVVSDLPPYADVEQGVTGLKARTVEQFRQGLRRLVNDADLRQRIGGAARAAVLQAHTLTARTPVWRALLADATGTAPRTGEYMMDADADGRACEAQRRREHPHAPTFDPDAEG
jgi:glycosyltransferase involved in cell wall biosynthesis